MSISGKQTQTKRGLEQAMSEAVYSDSEVSSCSDSEFEHESTSKTKKGGMNAKKIALIAGGAVVGCAGLYYVSTLGGSGSGKDSGNQVEVSKPPVVNVPEETTIKSEININEGGDTQSAETFTEGGETTSAEPTDNASPLEGRDCVACALTTATEGAGDGGKIETPRPGGQLTEGEEDDTNPEGDDAVFPGEDSTVGDITVGEDSKPEPEPITATPAPTPAPTETKPTPAAPATEPTPAAQKRKLRGLAAYDPRTKEGKRNLMKAAAGVGVAYAGASALSYGAHNGPAPAAFASAGAGGPSTFCAPQNFHHYKLDQQQRQMAAAQAPAAQAAGVDTVLRLQPTAADGFANLGNSSGFTGAADTGADNIPTAIVPERTHLQAAEDVIRAGVCAPHTGNRYAANEFVKKYGHAKTMFGDAADVVKTRYHDLFKGNGDGAEQTNGAGGETQTDNGDGGETDNAGETDIDGASPAPAGGENQGKQEATPKEDAAAAEAEELKELTAEPEDVNTAPAATQEISVEPATGERVDLTSADASAAQQPEEQPEEPKADPKEAALAGATADYNLSVKTFTKAGSKKTIAKMTAAFEALQAELADDKVSVEEFNIKAGEIGAQATIDSGKEYLGWSI